jgi:hypothetical protein
MLMNTRSRAFTWAMKLVQAHKRLRGAWGVRLQLERLLRDSLPPLVVKVLTSWSSI